MERALQLAYSERGNAGFQNVVHRAFEIVDDGD